MHIGQNAHSHNKRLSSTFFSMLTTTNKINNKKLKSNVSLTWKKHVLGMIIFGYLESFSNLMEQGDAKHVNWVNRGLESLQMKEEKRKDYEKLKDIILAHRNNDWSRRQAKPIQYCELLALLFIQASISLEQRSLRKWVCDHIGL